MKKSVKSEQTPTIVRILFIFYSFFFFTYVSFLDIIWKRGFFLFFQILPSWIRIRDIFGIPDPEPHKNLSGSETL